MPKPATSTASPAAGSRRKAQAAAAPRTNARGERRREAMLSAAQAVFLEHGYAGASLEEVIQRVGGSKASLYSYFGSKEGLFEQMVVNGCERFLRNVAIPTGIEGDLESTLRAFGLRFFKLFTDPNGVRLMRAIIAEATRFPEMAQQFYENGPKRARQQLAAFFAHCHAGGHMHAPDPDFAAIQFITLVKGHCQFRSLFGLSPLALTITPEAFVEQAVRLFLYGCQPPAKPNKKPARSRS